MPSSPPRPATRKLVVDTDTGIDDALALMLLASMTDVEIVAVTTTHGNCSTEASTANARFILDACGLANVPVIGGLSVPLEKELALSSHVHGNDGLGDCGLAPPPAEPAAPGNTAVEALIDFAATRPGELDLLALGPLTNLGAAVRADPEVLGGFGTVTIMGGAGKRRLPGEPDPTNGVGDPNTYHDGESTRLVVGAPAGELVAVGVDVTLHATAGADYLARIAAATTPHGQLAERFIQFYLDFYESRSGSRVLTLHDPIAALVAVGADIGATFDRGPLVVDGAVGEERLLLAPGADEGTLVGDMITSCDADAVAEVMVRALENPMPTRS